MVHSGSCLSTADKKKKRRGKVVNPTSKFAHTKDKNEVTKENLRRYGWYLGEGLDSLFFQKKT